MSNRIIVTQKGQEIQRIIKRDIQNEQLRLKQQTKNTLDDSDYLLQSALSSCSSLRMLENVNKKFQLATQSSKKASYLMADLFLQENNINPSEISPFVVSEVQRYSKEVIVPHKTSFSSVLTNNKTFNTKQSLLNSLRKSSNQTNNTNANVSGYLQNQLQNSYFQNSLAQNQERNSSQPKMSENNSQRNIISEKINPNNSQQSISEIGHAADNYQLQSNRQVRKSQDLSFLASSQKNIGIGIIKSSRESYLTKINDNNNEDDQIDEIQDNEVNNKLSKQQSLENLKKHITFSQNISSRGNNQSQERSMTEGRLGKSTDRQKSMPTLPNSSLNSSSLLLQQQDLYAIEKCNAILNCEARVDRILSRYKQHKQLSASIEARVKHMSEIKLSIQNEQNDQPPKTVQELRQQCTDLDNILSQKEYDENYKERIYAPTSQKYRQVWKSMKFPQLTQKFQNIMDEQNQKKMNHREIVQSTKHQRSNQYTEGRRSPSQYKE